MLRQRTCQQQTTSLLCGEQNNPTLSYCTFLSYTVRGAHASTLHIVYDDAKYNTGRFTVDLNGNAYVNYFYR